MRKFLFLFIVAALTMLFAGTVSAITIKGVQVDAETAKCISCHEDQVIAPKVNEQWSHSAHAKNGIGCLSCHMAEQSDFDAMDHYGQYVAKHPTPKDCSMCHPQEVEENTKSKHAYPFWLYASADRSVFEPIVGTKQGCESCHNISAMWPDGSVGECDVCHSKHTFDVKQARHPNTCGECHLGPDHPQREIYYESKHGNIFRANEAQVNLDYDSSEVAGIPLPSPVCTTCHMDDVPGVKGTHNVSARLAWEAQAPWSYRTIWFEEELGTWQEKNERMKTVCKNCHAPDFVEDYFMMYDLVNLQYNEIRRQFVKWAKLYVEEGLIKPLKETTVDGHTKAYSGTVINASWYTKASELLYNSWHHEGRRFRMGAAMQAPDYVQWHGIWELQHNLQEMIAWGAERGVEEAKKIYESDSPTKFFTYKIYDVPGGLYSLVTPEQFDVPMLYQVIPNYWEKARANVKAAYEQGLITKETWERWLTRYENKDKYLGKDYAGHEIFQKYNERRKKELVADDGPLSDAIGLDLPSETPFAEKEK